MLGTVVSYDSGVINVDIFMTFLSMGIMGKRTSVFRGHHFPC